MKPEKRVNLLTDDRAVAVQDRFSPADPVAPSPLTFPVRNLQPGLYVLRLRVDGVDSIPIDFSSTPLQFAATQTVRVIG